MRLIIEIEESETAEVIRIQRNEKCSLGDRRRVGLIFIALIKHSFPLLRFYLSPTLSAAAARFALNSIL